MNKISVFAIAIIIILIGAWYWYGASSASDSMTAAGSYTYICEDGSAFSMTPSADASELTLEAGSGSAFTGSVRLSKMGDAAHFETTEGELIVLSGAGEVVEITVAGKTVDCAPVPNAEMAPWNWGDAGEGGGMQQDVALIVTESIQGTWQSTEDSKSARVFGENNTVQDVYDGEVVWEGLYVAFTKENAPEISFPLEDGVVYIELTKNGTPEDTLTFKLTKLTPDALELIYMDRGGALTYKRVQ